MLTMRGLFSALATSATRPGRALGAGFVDLGCERDARRINRWLGCRSRGSSDAVGQSEAIIVGATGEKCCGHEAGG